MFKNDFNLKKMWRTLKYLSYSSMPKLYCYRCPGQQNWIGSKRYFNTFITISYTEKYYFYNYNAFESYDAITLSSLLEYCDQVTAIFPEEYRQYFISATVMGKLTCINQCHPDHPTPKICMNKGTCEVSKQGPSC